MSTGESTCLFSEDSMSRRTNDVLIMYTDTYFGRRMLKQFQNRKDRAGMRYRVYACMWNEDSVEDFPDRCSRLSLQPLLPPCAPPQNIGRTSSLPSEIVGLTAASVESSPQARGDRNEAPSSHLFTFWRRNVKVLRQAVLAADLIVVELRYAQDVFDVMHLLTTKILRKPKRLVLISSLLTWYATPPLQHIAVDETSVQSDSVDNEEEEEVNVPKEEVSRPMDPDEVEALLGPLEVGEEDNDTSRTEKDGSADELELLTEDQYNRRIPHAKYINWREAERVVASANSEERHLHTCVVFAGLSYGEGEDALQPLFRQVWSRGESGLPIYGAGLQIVPTVHIRDLVTFAWRLLEAEAPPASRYVFAVDNSNVSWRRMVMALNRAFGGEKTFYIPPAQYVLHKNVELFTMNLRVENNTMNEIMKEEDWVAKTGFIDCINKVAYEFIESHGLQPVRVVLLGPPLSGKTFLSQILAERHYHLPTFTIEKVREEYKQHIDMLKKRLELFRTCLYRREKLRREEAKKYAFLRPRKKVEEENKEYEEEREENHNEGKTSPQLDEPLTPNGDLGEECTRVVRCQTNVLEDDIDGAAVSFDLTEEELQEVEALVEEWYQSTERAAQIRDTIAAMERVLSMRVRVLPPSSTELPAMANPKKRKETLKQKRAVKGNKKAAGEGEEQNATLQESAPLQDKALALMMRWRLAQADCCNKGYVLDGFPETVDQARLIFGHAPLDIPDANEDTLISLPSGAGTHGKMVAMHESATMSTNVPPQGVEECDEHRLPDYVFALTAPENYLLDRLNALSRASGEVGSAEEKRLGRFDRALMIYHQQYTDTEYSLPNYFETARTVEKVLTPGGRTPKVVAVDVGDQPLLQPPPPESEFAVREPIPLEKLLCQHIGPSHTLGPSPKEVFEEEVRARKLEEEERQKQMRAITEQYERELRECKLESDKRTVTENVRRAIDMADREALEKRKIPLQMYLNSNIMPLLSRGLMEVCKTRPADPVDFLAGWLVRHNPHDDSCFDL
uniref:Adenylate kinase n=1 Tax=Trypanosoma congolense (strain IL3000) TaxID=1068625 RepID=G0UZX5_TRYCI|nr:conserved hypothetical protein [Trypanosoma congolense IL3000]